MATVKGDLKTVADSGTENHTNPAGSINALVRVSHDTYEASALASGSLIEIGTKLPLNSYVYEVIAAYDAMGSNTSLEVGDAEDPNRYITNTATTSAGVTRLNAITGLGYKIDETTASTTDRQVLAKVVDSGAMTGSLAVAIFWSNNS